MDDLRTEIRLTDGKVHFDGLSDLNASQPIPFDFPPPAGNGQGFTGLEMLLMSFSACVSTAIVLLLKRAGKTVAGYRAAAVGIRNERPLFLKKICLTVFIESNDIEAPDMENVIRQAELISPVWLALKGNVEVAADYKISRN